MENITQQPPITQPSAEIQPVNNNFINKHKLLFVLGAFVLILTGGVGGILLGKNLYAPANQQSRTGLPTGTPTEVVPTSSVPTNPTSGVVKGWRTYQNQKYGYSVSYPESWFNLQNFGAPDTDKYFSTKDVGVPLEMGSDGVWVTIRVGQDSDYYKKIFNSKVGLVSSGEKGVTTKLSDLTISGQNAVKYIEETTPGAPTEYGYVIAYAIKKDTSLFTISFLTFNKTIADNNMQIYDQMANSFRFLNSAWKEYKNTAYKFSIRYPQDWIVREYDSKSTKGVPMHGIGFGTVESIPGGMIWGVSVYDVVGDSNSEREDLIKEIGSQFADRQEKREQIVIKGREATKVIVTTGQYKDWYSETVIFEGNNKIFSIGNGAIKDARFEDFYQSFTYL